MPALRRLAGHYDTVSLRVISKLLESSFHEDRMLALLIAIRQYRTADEEGQKALYDFYLDHTECIDNWDLVDVSALHLVGAFLYRRSREPLYRLAGSPSLWERRISVVATFHFIRRNDFSETLRIAEMLLDDSEDLIHKATGWMLREIGKRDRTAEEWFLDRYCRRMPRTMLRYAVERFPQELRQYGNTNTI